MKDYLNINEAAKVTGLSIPTIRMKLERKLLPNASQVMDGKRKLWRIPFTDLVAAGLIDKTNSNSESAELHSEALTREIDRLEAELNHAKELLARADQELEQYRARERYLFQSLETKQVQEQRRSLWARVTGRD